MSIQGQHILITGAAGGIGRELVQKLAELGGVLILVDRDISKLQGIYEEVISNRCQVHIVPCDLLAPNAAQFLVTMAIEFTGHVDMVINCAGLAGFGLFEKQTVEQMEMLWRINLLVPMQLAKALIPQMVARGKGRIINIGSVFGSIGFAYFTNYSASKFGLRGFSEALRRELEGTGVSVTYIAPRYTKTALNEGAVSLMADAVGMNSDEPELVATHIVKAITANATDYYIGWPESLFVRINSIFPRLVDLALRKQNRKTHEFAVTA